MRETSDRNSADVSLLRKIVGILRDPYRLELHYMRGPGSKWCAAHSGHDPLPAHSSPWPHQSCGPLGRALDIIAESGGRAMAQDQNGRARRHRAHHGGKTMQNSMADFFRKNFGVPPPEG